MLQTKDTNIAYVVKKDKETITLRCWNIDSYEYTISKTYSFDDFEELYLIGVTAIYKLKDGIDEKRSTLIATL